jgi:uncharacterized protein with von Willebrand factor type A (vWA) domain
MAGFLRTSPLSELQRCAVSLQVFNGGSDFNEPIKRCLDRLHTSAWANSDILLVSDGELRQPGQEIMRKLAGAEGVDPRTMRY